MKKNVLIILIFVAVIGAILFQDLILNMFRDMGPLESIKVIWTFVLHVAVTTALAYGAYTIPEIIKPWLKTFRWKQRAIRHGRHEGKWQSGPNAHWGRTGSQGPKLTRNDLILMSLLQGCNMQDMPRFDLSRFSEPDDDDDELDIQL